MILLEGLNMTVELIKIMKEDIKRYDDAQGWNEGSYCLYQSLIAKYNTMKNN